MVASLATSSAVVHSRVDFQKSVKSGLVISASYAFEVRLFEYGGNGGYAKAGTKSRLTVSAII